MRPRQPALDPLLDVIAVLDRIDDGFGLFAAENGEPEQIVQSAAIDPDDDNLASFKQAFEGQRLVCLALPEFDPGPPITSKPDADFDVEMLGEEQLEGIAPLMLLFSELLPDPFRVYRTPKARIWDVPCRGIVPRFGLLHSFRIFVNQRKRCAVADFTIAHRTVVVQFLLEHASRLIVGLRRGVNHEAFGAGRQRAGGLGQYVFGSGFLAEQPELVDENTDSLLAADDIGICRFHREHRAIEPVDNLPRGVAGLVSLEERLVGFHHAVSGEKTIVGNVFGRRQDQILALGPLVHDEGREHDARGETALAVLFCHANEKFADQLPPCFGILCAEDRPDEIKHPRFAGISHPRLARHVDQA
jgi:hypothetical protein